MTETSPTFIADVRGDSRKKLEAAARQKAGDFFGGLIQIELQLDYEARENTLGGGKYIATISTRQATGRRTI